MPLRLEIKRELSARSERVKCVDIHPSEPWILSALFSGNVMIWNYQTETSVKTFECCDVPVRSAKFISRKHWVICGADDMNIRVYNYNTMEKIKTFEAHSDYIRGLAVHPTLPYVISGSDDMSIKMWDWDKDWSNAQVFEGHTHYVMQLEFNPKDSNTFASASLDHSVKVWGLGSRMPHFSLEGHQRGVNCVSYFHGGDRPYLISGADDQTVKIWDYQTKSCVTTLDGHSNNVSAVVFHPVLPLIISGSEDGTVRLWHSTTFRLENTLNYGMERVWTIACHKESNKVALGYDEGTIMIKIGHEEPVVSMDRVGKIIWAKNHEFISANVKNLSSKHPLADGERLPLILQEKGSCEIYPQAISHDPKARHLAVCGDSEYIIYTAVSLKNKHFGQALEFVWAFNSGMFATRESTSKIKIFKNFAEHRSFRPPYSVEGIFGGALLGMRSNDFVDFYDWETCSIIRRVEVCPRLVCWSESGELVVIAAESSYFVLRFNNDLVTKYLNQKVEVGEQGIEGAFELEQEVGEHVITGEFIGDCFIYTNAANRLNYSVGSEVITLSHLDKPYYLLGYLPKEDHVYLMDKSYNIVSFTLLLSVLMYETAIIRKDYEAAQHVLMQIPREHHDKLARFLEGQGLQQMALEVTTDPEHKFELSVQLKNLDLARQLCHEEPSHSKWKALGDAALDCNDLDLAKGCFTESKDCGGLLLILTSVGDQAGLANLAELAKSSFQFNVAFIAFFLIGRVDDCLKLLVETGRVAEAAMMARSYAPSAMPRLVELWKENLRTSNANAADAIASPDSHLDLFPEYQAKLLAESLLSSEWSKTLPANVYLEEKAKRCDRDVLQMAKNGELDRNTPARSPSLDVSSTPSPSPKPRKSPIKSSSPSGQKPISRSASPQRSNRSQESTHSARSNSSFLSPKSPNMVDQASSSEQVDLEPPEPSDPEILLASDGDNMPSPVAFAIPTLTGDNLPSPGAFASPTLAGPIDEPSRSRSPLTKSSPRKSQPQSPSIERSQQPPSQSPSVRESRPIIATPPSLPNVDMLEFDSFLQSSNGTTTNPISPLPNDVSLLSENWMGDLMQNGQDDVLHDDEYNEFLADTNPGNSYNNTNIDDLDDFEF